MSIAELESLIDLQEQEIVRRSATTASGTAPMTNQIPGKDIDAVADQPTGHASKTPPVVSQSVNDHQLGPGIAAWRLPPMDKTDQAAPQVI
jgi:hypothetical protein